MIPISFTSLIFARLMAAYKFSPLLLFLCLLIGGNISFAQLSGQGTTSPTGAPNKDTSMAKTNTNSWKNYTTRTSYKKLNSEKVYYPDTSLHTFHRRPFSQAWQQDMGNLGSPTQNLLFTPEDRLGPTLGYHVFDVYRFLPDSLCFYNTNRPYSEFTYQLGSKLEQMASVLFSANVKPNWNFTFDYRKVNSPGYYKIQRTNHDAVYLSSNYKSLNQHYELYAGIIYNKMQQDENGGITADSQLLYQDYADKQTMDVAFENPNYSITRSSVTNMQRDFTIMLQHGYTWGKTDTFYSQDSTQYTYKLKPRFRITHKMELSTEKHEFKDLVPDSTRYAATGLFNHGFINGDFYTPGQDSVLSQQKWFWIDNRILINGFVGKPGNELAFSAGAGNRLDQFTTAYGTGSTQSNLTNNYLVGEIKKEALHPGEWFYQANTQFFLTGSEAGNFLLHASLGRELKNNWGDLVAGFQQSLNSAPYNYTIFETEYDTITKSYNKESVTQVYATISSPKLRFSVSFHNYLINNYIYINQQELPAQYSNSFNISQLSVRKVFKVWKFYLDNEFAYQQVTADAPINVPALLGRHQLSIESDMFKTSLRVATGIEVRYNTSYYAAGYDPFFNRFYYQNTYYTGNSFPVASVFLNFRVKRFRAYIMGDQLQEFFFKNNINYHGYPAQDAMVRFGFVWMMVN